MPERPKPTPAPVHSAGRDETFTQGDGGTPPPPPHDPPSRTFVTGPGYAFLAPSDDPDALGMLGPYRVVRLLGEGGMGFVFRAEDDALRRPVALKVMRPEVAAGPLAAERFLREGRAAAALKSDHVTTIYQVGEANGVPFLAMEYLEGATLDDWLKARPGPATPTVVAKVARDTLRGLAAAHDKGLVHRDIKPSNLWLERPTGRVKVLDFGLTRGADGNDQFTRDGAVVGTPSYMSPEQANGGKVDGRADLFSVGVVLYRMVAGQSPFARDTVMGTLTSLAVDVPPPLDAAHPAFPADLAAFVARLLAKDRDGRPANAKAALAELLAIEKKLKASAAPGLSGSQPIPVPRPPAAASLSRPMVLPESARPPAESGLTPTLLTTPPVDPTPAPASVPSPKPAAARRKPVSKLLIAAAGLLGLFAAGVGAVIVVKLRDKDGKETVITVPDGTTVVVEKDGKPVATVDPKGVAAIPAKPVTIDLLPLIDPDKDAVSGIWAKGSLGLAGTPPDKSSDPRSMILAPYAPPAEYDVAAEFTLPPDGGDYALEFAWDGRPLTWMIRPSTGRMGFTTIGGKGPSSPDWSGAADLDKSTRGRHRVVVRIRKGGVEAEWNGRVVTAWRGTSAQVSKANDPRPEPLVGVSLKDSGTVLHSLAVTEVTGTGTLTRPPSPFPPLDPAWVAKVRVMTPDARAAEVVAELKRRNPGYDGAIKFTPHPLKPNDFQGHVTIVSDSVADLSPLQGFPNLLRLDCFPPAGKQGILADLSPLVGLPIDGVEVPNNRVADLRPLKSMPVGRLYAFNNRITDLSPLAGKRMWALYVSGNPVTRLDVLRGMDELYDLHVPAEALADPALVRGLKGLKRLNGKTAAEFWKEFDAARPPALPPLDPAWVAKVRAMTPDAQEKEVAAEFVRRNPGSESALTVEKRHADGTVLVVKVDTSNVADLSPLAAFPELEKLHAWGRSPTERGILRDLRLLAGLGKLWHLNVSNNPVADLTPLQGVRLKQLNLSYTDVTDLSPLAGQELEHVFLTVTKVKDLSPLRGMPLTRLGVAVQHSIDLEPLKGAPLTWVYCINVRGLRFFADTIQEIAVAGALTIPAEDEKALKQSKSLKTIGQKPAAEFWKEYDAKPKADPDRTAAEALLPHFESIGVRLPSGVSVSVKSGDSLPAGPFTLTALSRAKPSPPKGFVDDVLVPAVAPLAGLEAVYDPFANLAFSEAAVARLAAAPCRDTLVKLVSPVPLTGTTIDALKTFPKLTELTLRVGRAGAADVARLGELTTTTNLKIENMIGSEAGWGAITGLSLQSLTLVRCKGLDAAAGSRIAAMPTLTERLNLYECDLDADALTALGRSPRLIHLGLYKCKYPEAGVAAAAAIPTLSVLEVEGGPFGDGGVDALAKTSGPKRLVLKGTKVTADGVKRLRAAWPKCKVEWDGDAAAPK